MHFIPFKMRYSCVVISRLADVHADFQTDMHPDVVKNSQRFKFPRTHKYLNVCMDDQQFPDACRTGLKVLILRRDIP